MSAKPPTTQAYLEQMRAHYDPADRLIIQAFDNVIKREIAEADEVRKEVANRGTYWAGDEIWKLRRQVAALQRRLAEQEMSER